LAGVEPEASGGSVGVEQRVTAFPGSEGVDSNPDAARQVADLHQFVRRTLFGPVDLGTAFLVGVQFDIVSRVCL
jgi:hypothetical protein